VLRGSLIVDLLIARLPEEIRDELMQETDLQERASARFSMLSSEEIEQSFREADAHWRMGELAQARRIWNRLAPMNGAREEEFSWRFPVPSPEHEPQVRARLAAADLLQGRRRSAESRRALLEERFPEAEGDLAGMTGTYVSILKTLLEETRDAPAETFLPMPESDWLPSQPVRVSLLSREWSVPLFENEHSETFRIPSRTTSASRPVVWKDVVLIQDASGVRALDLASGTSAWPAGENDPGLLIPDSTVATVPLPPARVQIETASRGGTVDLDWWLGRLGPNWISPGEIPDGAPESRIVALDLDAEGLLQWTRSVREFPSEAIRGQQIFSGEPLSDGEGCVYVPIRDRQPGDVLSLACLDASFGEPRWITRIGSVQADAGERPIAGSDRLKIEGDRLLWNIDGLGVLGLDRSDGSWDWLTALPASSRRSTAGPVNDLHAEPDQVVALSPGRATALDPTTGAIDWSTELATAPHRILGVVDDVLILSGRDLWGLNRFSGAVLWRRGGEALPRSGQGRGLLLGRSILWPTKEELWTVDAFTGQLRQRDFLKQLSQIEGGHLTLADAHLLITGPERVTSFRILLHDAPP
jgi:outer membrane protein assembly factor BamB